jgi:hypothetical protein
LLYVLFALLQKDSVLKSKSFLFTFGVEGGWTSSLLRRAVCLGLTAFLILG